MKVRIRYQDKDNNTAEQVFLEALETTHEKDGKKLVVADQENSLHVDWIE